MLYFPIKAQEDYILSPIYQSHLQGTTLQIYRLKGRSI